MGEASRSMLLVQAVKYAPAIWGCQAHFHHILWLIFRSDAI